MTDEGRDDQSGQPDPLKLFDDLAEWFEALRGMVAAHVAEGFTDEQARTLVTHLIRTAGQAAS